MLVALSPDPDLLLLLLLFIAVNRCRSSRTSRTRRFASSTVTSTTLRTQGSGSTVTTPWSSGSRSSTTSFAAPEINPRPERRHGWLLRSSLTPLGASWESTRARARAEPTLLLLGSSATAQRDCRPWRSSASGSCRTSSLATRRRLCRLLSRTWISAVVFGLTADSTKVPWLLKHRCEAF